MLGNQSNQFDVRMPLGSQASWTISMFEQDGITPFAIAGHTFQYVVSTAPVGASPAGTVIIQLESDNSGNPTPSGGGLITVASSSVDSSVTLALFPPATSALTPITYYHALWMDYADPVNAYNMWWGQMMIDPTVQAVA